MDNLDYIDDYFKSNPTVEKKQAFEERILKDKEFAEDVAFYISIHSAVKEQLHTEKKQQFRHLYEQQKTIAVKPTRTINLWQYVAAASIIAIIIVSSLFIFTKNPSAEQLANKYINEQLQTQSVTMGSRQDSIQSGLDMFNNGQLNNALQQFELILQKDSTNEDAKKYAGIVSLRLNNYDKALYYFRWLGKNDNLYSNPGKFYEALTLLKRNKAGDMDEAKKLLKEVKENKLEGEQTATDWLEKL